MKHFKVVFWLNTPSHYQRVFMEALRARPEIDLQVRYFQKFSSERFKQGWREGEFRSYEKLVASPDELYDIADYQERIHVINGCGYEFNVELLKRLRNQQLAWVHWSEPYGGNIGKKTFYLPWLMDAILPIAFRSRQWYFRLLRQEALAVFAQGLMGKRNFVRLGVPEDKIDYLYYCGDAQRQTRDLTAELQLTGKRVFLYVGQLNYRKGIDVLLKAFAALRQRDNWKLVLIGYDRGRGQYQRLCDKLGIAEQVCFVPPVAPEDVGNAEALADVLILPSRYDGWGIVLNEAASLGKALIGTDRCGASWQVIKEGRNGMKVKAGSVPALSAAMQVFIDDPEQIRSMGQESLAIFDAEFTPACNAERFISALQRRVP